MTTIDTHQDAGATPAAASSAPRRSVVLAVADWATTTDHKKIGRLFTGFGLLELVVVAALGIALAAERISDSAVFDADALLQLFQGYRIGLVFAVAAPLAIGLSIAVAPIQVGARTMAFPRIALFGFYLWLGGLGFTYGALLANGGIGGGNADMVDLFLIGNALMMAGLAAAALTVATTVLTTRAPGMRLGRVPIFAWSALVGSIGVLLVLPVAIGVTFYLYMDRRYGGAQTFGGAEGIEAWLGWVYSTPAVLVCTLPAFGVFAELLPVTFRSPGILPGVRRTSVALIGVVALAALTQQRTFPLTFGGDQSIADFVSDLVAFALFVGLPLVGLAGSGLVSLGSMRAGSKAGRPRLNAPFTFGLFALLLLLAAFIGNAMLSITNFELADTTFEEGVVVLAVYGTVMAVLAGLLFWAPKFSGKIVSAAKVLPVALLLVLGAVLAAGAMLIAGGLGQPGTVPNNDAAIRMLLNASDTSVWNVVSLAGHGIFALGVVVFALAIITTKVPDDRPIPDNPYGAFTVEWTAASPAPEHNFEHVPAVSSAVPAYRPNATVVVEGSES